MARPLIEVHNIFKSFGTQHVLKDLSFFIAENQKIALIGRNGSGKSTLMKLLTGEEELDEGQIIIHPWTKVGVVRQHEVLPKDTKVLDYLEEVTGQPDWQVKKIASQFALKDEHLQKTPSDLSGGYQMRVKITRMLLSEPNLLLLDEPVNYLDLQTLLLLERFLKTYRGSMVIIAHDRAFLEHTCTTTFEIERSGLTTFNGKVSIYQDFKEEQKEFTLKQNKKLAQEITHKQKFVDRFRYKANLASQAQSKIKHIDKLRRELKDIKADLATSRIRLNCSPISKGLALRLENVVIGYNQKPLASGITLDVMRGEHVLLAGENGSGKSTLLKTITGETPNLSGTIKWWHRSTIGYYNQFTEKTLNPNETVLQHLQRFAPASTSSEKILMMAGNFLFQGDDLDKKTAVLSGGERSRLCLAGILLHEYNTLILDEPSNHLDLETSKALAEALRDYVGTVIFVSHAQDFVKTLAHKIFEINNNRISEFMGDYAMYIEDIREQALESLDDNKTSKSQNSQSAFLRKQANSTIRLLHKTQTKLLAEIEVLSKEKSEILMFYFENPAEYAPEKHSRLTEIDGELEDLEKKWMNDEQKIENLRDSTGAV